MKLRCLLAMSLFFLTVIAGETVLYQESGEDQLPGQPVNQWWMLFGSKTGLTMRISNIRSTDGTNSIEFCNTGAGKYYAYTIHLDPPFRGILCVSFNIFCSGTGSSLSFELREKKNIGKTLFFANAGTNLIMNSNLDKTFPEKTKNKANCGPMKRDTWYRVTLRMPLNTDAGKTAELSLKDLSAGLEVKDYLVIRYPETPMFWIFGGGGKKTEYRVWLDEIKISLKDQ